MKRKLLIVSASVIVLAFIVAIGIHAQSGPNSKNATTEQTTKCTPEKCKQCPSYSKCVEANSQTDTTATACKEKCKEKKCCASSSECKDMKKYDKAKTCPQSSECKKKCEKK